MAVKQKVVECVSPVENRLEHIIRTLEQHMVTEQGFHDRICTPIISLGTINVPKDAEKFKEFKEDFKRVKEILTKECMKENLVTVALKALFHEISTSDKNPSPVMSVVLELIDANQIPNAVRSVLNSEYSPEELKRALMTLCLWLSKWSYTKNLSPVVLHFMMELENQEYHNIVKEVILATVEKLFRLLILKDHRKIVGPVIVHMLKSNPEAFHRIISQIKIVINFLDQENTDSSRLYLWDVIRICVLLMQRYPEYFEPYENLKQKLQSFFPAPQTTLAVGKSALSQVDASISFFSNMGKVGLNNLGNTCYMNSVLQSLFMTKSFRNQILHLKNETSPLYVKLQSLFALLQFSHRISLSPTDISNLARPPGFLPGHQQDSSEFLGYLLDILHEQENTADKMDLDTPDDGASGDTGTDTVVQSIFGGRTMSMSQCGKCHRKSERLDNFRELQLSIPNSTENQSVQNLLDYYLQPEKLSGDNQYHCDVCNSLTDGERVTTIEEAPPRLILTLKHFRYDPASQQRTKLLQSVRLDNHIHLAETQYELYAAVVHCGSNVDSGHYYTFAREAGNWFKFNDCSVTGTSADELCTLKPLETPYILFYSRIDNSDPEDLTPNLLSQSLQSLIVEDHREFERERNRGPLKSFKAQNRNDEPPPPSCGGPGFAANSSNMYVC